MKLDVSSLAHTKWECKYHIVFAPKYRRQIIYGKIKQDIGQMLRKLCEYKGIETSFRNLKHTLGLLHLHAKKVEFVLQEIFAKLTMYNFCELITQSVVIRQAQKTHTYKVNFSDAVHICRQFFLGDVPPPILEAMLMRYISPIRPGRKDTRKLTQKSSASFTYRVA